MNFLWRFALQEKKLDDSSHLHIAENVCVTYMLPFSLCNKKILAIWHMHRPLFPMTLSILSYNIGK
jgi:hypothetical protein